jgi:hypothetical protein
VFLQTNIKSENFQTGSDTDTSSETTEQPDFYPSSPKIIVKLERSTIFSEEDTLNSCPNSPLVNESTGVAREFGIQCELGCETLLNNIKFFVKSDQNKN